MQWWAEVSHKRLDSWSHEFYETNLAKFKQNTRGVPAFDGVPVGVSEELGENQWWKQGAQQLQYDRNSQLIDIFATLDVLQQQERPAVASTSRQSLPTSIPARAPSKPPSGPASGSAPSNALLLPQTSVPLLAQPPPPQRKRRHQDLLDPTIPTSPAAPSTSSHTGTSTLADSTSEQFKTSAPGGSDPVEFGSGEHVDLARTGPLSEEEIGLLEYPFTSVRFVVTNIYLLAF